MTIASGAIVIYCFRNHEFMEGNLIKRRYHSTQVVLMVAHFFVLYFYYLNVSIIVPMKHCIAHFIGAAFLVDFFTLSPFQNEESSKMIISPVSRFYIVCVAAFEISMSVCSLWIFTE
jgi:hypothetical protein